MCTESDKKYSEKSWTIHSETRIVLSCMSIQKLKLLYPTTFLIGPHAFCNDLSLVVKMDCSYFFAEILGWEKASPFRAFI